MKKYHLADVLTLLETICAIVLCIMGIFHVSANYAVWIFAIGVVCDAFDGPCARAWHYPNDGKHRWWREKAELTDKISDLMIGTAAFIYIGYCVNTKLGQYGFLAAFIIGCLVQIIVYPTWGNIKCFDLQSRQPRLAQSLICARRFLYASGTVLGIFIMIHATTWSKQVKIAFDVFLITCGLVALKLKFNRLTEDKAPL